MSDDLEGRLRAARSAMPAPDPSYNSAMEERFVARLSATPSTGRQRTARSSRLLIAAAVAVIAVGAFFLGSAFPVTARSANDAPNVEAPGFLPAPGWTEVSTGKIPMSDGPTVIATNGRLAQENGPVGTFPTQTLEQLGPEGIVFYVVLGNRADANSNYIARQLPLQLSDANIKSSWEGMPRPDIPLYQLPVEVGHYILEVDVFFGAAHPNAAQIADAQQELNRLVVPGHELPAEAAARIAAQRAAEAAARLAAEARLQRKAMLRARAQLRAAERRLRQKARTQK